MCKSAAEGGARCQAHTRQNVTAQMSSYVTAVTPLNSAMTREVIADLEREGQNLPDPSREEVDGWIEGQMAQVRFESNLTESRRERILKHLREALGKVLPSGATFHAWKNVMAEAWSRSKRKATVFFAAGLITFSGGCGISPGDASPEPPAPTGTVQVVDGYPEYASASLPQPDVSADVEAKFGKADSLAAYNMGADLILKNQLEGEHLGTPINEVKASDLAEVRSHLSPDRQKDFDARVKDMGSDEEAYAAVVALTGVGVGQGDISVTDPGSGKAYKGGLRTDVKDPGFNRSIQSPKLTVDTDGRLKATFKSGGSLRVHANDKNYVVSISNTTSMWFAKDGGQWKIDGWSADWSQQSPAAVVDKH